MNVRGIRAVYIKAFFVLITSVALYWQDLSIIMKEALKNDLTTYHIAIPFMLLFIIFRMRKTILASESNQYNNHAFTRLYPIKEIAGASLCILAYSIKGFGNYTFFPIEYHIASLPLFVSGMILIIFNVKTLRILIFPIAFLLLFIPPPIEFAMIIGSFLADLSSKIAYTFVKYIGLSINLAHSYGNPIIYLTTLKGSEIPFVIDAACSGLHSLMGFIIFAIFITYISSGFFLKKFFVFISGLILILLLNISRIILLLIIGYYFGLNLALNTFHLLGGWTLIFIGTLSLLTITEKIIKIPILRESQEICPFCKDIKNSYCTGCGKIFKINSIPFSNNDFFKISLISIFVIFLLFIQVPVFVLTEGEINNLPENPTGEQAYMKFLPEIYGYDLKFYNRDLEFENISGQDLSLFYKYDRTSEQSDHIDPLRRTVWLGLEIGPTKACLHDWEVCLIIWRQQVGLDVTVIPQDIREIHLLTNPPLSARYFAFLDTDSNINQVILYWYVKMNFKTNEVYQEKWSKISVISYTQNVNNIRNVEEELFQIAKEISRYWKPVEEWSQLEMSLGEHRETFLILSALPLFGIIPFTIFFKRKKRDDAKRIYTYLTDKNDIIILDIIKSNNKNYVGELEILSEYNKIANKKLDLDGLKNKMYQAKKGGLIDTKIISKVGVPYVYWKSFF